MTDAPVIARIENRIGRLTLNRPKALNALDRPMLALIAQALAEWRDDPAIHAVVIEGASDRAFCAGGDIRAIRARAQAGDRPRSNTSSPRNTRSTPRSPNTRSPMSR